jgi:putative transposase
MGKFRRRHDGAFKARVALESLKEEKTIVELSSEYGVHGNQIRKWRKQLLDALPGLFTDRRARSDKEQGELVSELYRQIGQLKVELDWLKKNLNSSVEAKRTLIKPDHLEIPVYRQCELLGLSRSSYDYRPRAESELNLLLMRLIDEQYTRRPLYGVPRMTTWLRR